MKKVLLAAAALAAMGVVPAIAADLGRPAPVYKASPVVAAAYDWKRQHRLRTGGRLDGSDV